MEVALTEKLSKQLVVNSRQYGFQKGSSPTATLLDVDALVRSGRNKIAVFDLAKSYEKVNRKILPND